MRGEFDEVGQVEIPWGLREEVGLAINDSVEVWIDGNTLALHKFNPQCVFCKAQLELISFKGKFICQDCHEEILLL